VEEWKILPQRHREHIEEGMEKMEGWKMGKFDNSTIR
jgi:hypothetical protein